MVSGIVRFCRALREDGLLVGPSETADALRSLGLVNLMDRDQVYWALRTVLVSRVDDITAFDERFRLFWTFHPPPDEPHSVQPPIVRGRVQPTYGTVGAERDEVGSDCERHPLVPAIRARASSVEVFSRRDLSSMDGKQRAEVAEIARRLLRSLPARPARPGRRLRRHKRKGRPDLRGALRLSLSHGGDLIEVPRRRRAPRIPRLLVLLDVSGSMDRHAELLLQLVYSLGQRGGRVETFVFSTSLTRVSRYLKAPTFGEGLDRVGRAVQHWSGGTRIGECLGALNVDYPHLIDGSTSIFLLSDGWETGDPDRLAREMALLRRRARRIVWLNPLLGTPGYEPLTLGLQASLKYVDTFASALDIDQLRRLPRLLRG